MPEGTRVHNLYTKLLTQGYSKGSAARIAQAKTGQSLQTGKAPKKKEK
jgi:hypothetical protein